MPAVATQGVTKRSGDRIVVADPGYGYGAALAVVAVAVVAATGVFARRDVTA